MTESSFGVILLDVISLLSPVILALNLVIKLHTRVPRNFSIIDWVTMGL